jgi:holo-[acyl-carrier protein] synthase
VIVGIGIDQVEVARLRALLDRWPARARERLFTDEERRTCDGRARPAECFAARFAAKEACLKALGTGWRGSLSWTEIEVATADGGRPVLRLSGTVEEKARDVGADSLHVSCTHDGGMAAAVVVLER